MFIEANCIHSTCLVLLIALYVGWVGLIVSRGKGFDFYAYYLGAHSFRQGVNVYTSNLADRDWWDAFAADLNLPSQYAFPYRYPPLTAVMVMPLLDLGPRAAFAIWSALGCLALFGTIWLIEQTLPQSSNLPWISLLISLPVLTTLYAGQVNTWLLFSFALALFGLDKNRPWLTGFGIAFGASVKVLPILLLPYLFWRKEWRAIFFTLVFLSAISLSCLPFVGLKNTLDAPSYIFHEGSRLPSLNVANQSVGGAIYRLFTNSSSPAIVDAPGLALPVYTALRVVIAVSAFFLFWPIWQRSNRLNLEFSYVVVAILIFAPLAWYHYLALTVLPIGILAVYYSQNRQLWGLWVLGGGEVLLSIHGVIWKQIVSIPVLNSGAAILTLCLLVLFSLALYHSRTSENSGTGKLHSSSKTKVI